MRFCALAPSFCSTNTHTWTWKSADSPIVIHLHAQRGDFVRSINIHTLIHAVNNCACQYRNRKPRFVTHTHKRTHLCSQALMARTFIFVSIAHVVCRFALAVVRLAYAKHHVHLDQQNFQIIFFFDHLQYEQLYLVENPTTFEWAQISTKKQTQIFCLFLIII